MKKKKPYEDCQLAFAECQNKGKITEKLVCKFRCTCDPCHSPTEEVIELRGQCQPSPAENNEKECLKYRQKAIGMGDC